MGHCTSKPRYSPPKKYPNLKRYQKQPYFNPQTYSSPYQPIKNPKSPRSSRIRTQSQYKKKVGQTDKEMALFITINNQKAMMMVKLKTRLSEFRKEKNLQYEQRFMIVIQKQRLIIELVFEEIFTLQDILLSTLANKHEIEIVQISVTDNLSKQLEKQWKNKLPIFPYNLNKHLIINRKGFSPHSVIKVSNHTTLQWIRNTLRLGTFEYFYIENQTIIQRASQNKVKAVEIATKNTLKIGYK